MARAEAVFQQIVSRGRVRPDAICYKTLIDAAVKANDTARAEHWLSAMLESGVAPSICSYTVVLQAHARAGDTEQAERVLERMRASGVDANVVIYSMVLNACAKAGDYLRAEAWLEAMREGGVQPCVVCYNSVIGACTKAGLPERAEVWLRHLTGDEHEKWERDPYLEASRQSYTTAAQAYASQGRFPDVERLIAEMEQRGIVMDEFSLTVLLSSYARARPRKRDRAEAAFRDYVARGLAVTKPPLHVLRTIVGAQRFERLLAEAQVSVP